MSETMQRMAASCLKVIVIGMLVLAMLLASEAQARYDNDMIARKIITDIQWNNEDSWIEVHYIFFQYVPGQGINHYPSKLTIMADSFADEAMNDAKAFEFVMKHDYSSVFQSDSIFGQKTIAYGSLVGQSYTEEKLDEMINQAIADIETAVKLKDESAGAVAAEEPFKRVEIHPIEKAEEAMLASVEEEGGRSSMELMRYVLFAFIASGTVLAAGRWLSGRKKQ